MHDIFIVVWAAIVIIGMASSIVSTARKAAQRSSVARAPAATPPRAAVPVRAVPNQAGRDAAAQVEAWLRAGGAGVWTTAAAPQAVAARPVPPPQPQTPPRPKPRAATPPQPGEHEFPMATHARRGIFGDAAGLRRAVIAAEVLGKPLALRDE